MEVVFMDSILFEPFPDSALVGAVCALIGIKDAVIIVHGKSCCHSDNLLFNLLLGVHDDVRVLGSGIRSQDVLTGGYRKLSIAIRSAYKKLHPKLIAVLITSFTSMMADDVEGIIESVKDEIPSEICFFQCAGHIGDFGFGYKNVLNKMVSYMKEEDKKENTVNILGIKQYDPCSIWDMKEIERILSRHGIKVNSFITGSSFDRIKSASCASLNLVLSDDAISCADLMKERFGIPYIRLSYPFGIKETEAFLKNTLSFFEKDLDQRFLKKEKDMIKERVQKIYKYLQGIYGLPVAVFGKMERAISFSRFLSKELGLNIRLLFIKDKKEKDIKIDAEEVIFSKNQKVLEDVLKEREKEVAVCFGSTLEKRICNELGIPLVRCFFPVLDEISILDKPFVGFRGVISIVEKIVNSIIGA